MDNSIHNSAAGNLCSTQDFAKITFLYTKHNGLVAQSKISSEEDCRPQNNQSCAGANFEHQTFTVRSFKPFKSTTQGKEIMFCSPSAYFTCSSHSLGALARMHHLCLFYRATKSYADLCGLARGRIFFQFDTFQPGLQGLAQEQLEFTTSLQIQSPCSKPDFAEQWL